jgi:hypothetical protein
MHKIGLDTSSIDYCIRNNISGTELKEFLQAQNLSPMICTYVIYEISRAFFKRITMSAKLFEFILDLEPQYIAPREKLYFRECEKLVKNSNFHDLSDKADKEEIIYRMNTYMSGHMPAKHAQYIRKRQESLDELNKIFIPSEIEKEKIKKYKSSLQSIEALFSALCRKDATSIEWFKKCILQVTYNKIDLSDDNVYKFSNNISEYRIISALIRNILHLHFLTHKNGNKPHENRFTDGLVLIEYSYCDYFLSHDKKLLDTHIKAINPAISSYSVSNMVHMITEQ